MRKEYDPVDYALAWVACAIIVLVTVGVVGRVAIWLLGSWL